MGHLQLYNNSVKEIKGVASNTQNSFSTKSDIRDGMTNTQIANVISNQLISHVDKALERVKQK